MPAPLRRRRQAGQRPKDADAALLDSMINPDLADRAQVRERYADLHASLWSRSWSSSPDQHVGLLTGPMLPNALERYGRAAAFAGVEMSSPLLDRRLIEFCLALPARQRGLHGYGKSILRRSMRGLAPDLTVERRDFSDLGAAVTVQFTKLLFEELEETLRGAKGALEGYVRYELIADALERFPRGQDAASAFRLWKAFTLASWLRRNA
ncbi:MAG: asparagine synthase C-terminal domain-containing protein [Planctomycetota bacterium]|nr:asparagine synthase C-terminal domain-containing protein [Planctomycetota bacterium]